MKTLLLIALSLALTGCATQEKAQTDANAITVPAMQFHRMEYSRE